MFNELFSGSPKFDYNADTNKYVSIREFLKDHDKELTYQVKGMFITKTSKYGPCGIIVIDGFNVRTPKFVNVKIESIMHNPDMVAAINEGKCGMVFRDYEKDGNIYTTVDLVDYAI